MRPSHSPPVVGPMHGRPHKPASQVGSIRARQDEVDETSSSSSSQGWSTMPTEPDRIIKITGEIWKIIFAFAR